MAEDGTYDVVVLGGGPGGYAAALRAALLELDVAIVERDKVGGTCLHRGCIPTKALLHTAEVVDTIRGAGDFGISVGDPEVDWETVRKKEFEPTDRLHKGLAGVIRKRGIDTIEGNGTLGERGTILVEGDGESREVRGEHVVLAPGSYAKSLPGMDPDGEKIITSDHALNLETLPKSLCVIGAGAVGVEFASIFRSFGADVTLLEALPRIVPVEDADVSKELTRSFKKRGIDVHAGAKVEDVDTSGEGCTVTFTEDGDTSTVEVEKVLVAVGRGAATDGLDLERWGVSTDRGFIEIDGENRAADGVWSIGDCTAGTPQLAHVAFGMGFNVAERIAGGTPVTVDFETDVPRAVYCVPEIGAVGLTEDEATERGFDVQVTKHSFAGIAKAQIMHEGTGFSKIVAERDGRILGIHMIGPRVTELLAEALLATGWEAMPAEVAALVHPHPTLSEVVGEAALEAIGRPLHG